MTSKIGVDMTVLTGPLAQSLQRQRATLNAKFAAAQKAEGRLEVGAFLDHLVQTVDPIVRSIAVDFAEKVDPVTLALYDLSLELFDAMLLGPQAKYPAVPEVWLRLLPKVPRLLGREPMKVAGALSNAAYQLAVTPGAKSRQWIEQMEIAVAHCHDVSTLLDAGKVLAWRAGMAHYREGALATARQMEPALAASLLGLPETTAAAAVVAVLERMATDPWVTPTAALAGPQNPGRLRRVGQAGAFRGFGGVFLCPPVVSFANGHLMVSDGQSSWMMLADVYGCALHRVGSGPLVASRSAEGVKIGTGGAVRWGQAAGSLAELAHCTSVACSGRTLAFTLPNSHHVFLLAGG